MTEKEAKDVVRIGVVPGEIDSVDLGYARGYLEAIKKVKALVKAYRDIITSSIPDSNGRTFHIYNSEMKDFENTLAKWEEEK